MLPSRYTHILTNASATESLPTVDDETQVCLSPSRYSTLNFNQALLSKCLTHLRALHSLIGELSIFSSNETVDDISTRDLVYLTVPYVFAEIQNRVRTESREHRVNSLIQIQVRLLRAIPGFVDLTASVELSPKFHERIGNVSYRS